MKRCDMCNDMDATGLINGMCTACYCLTKNIGENKKDYEKWKKGMRLLVMRRYDNGWYEKD